MKKIFTVMIFLFLVVDSYAANGDLTVNGIINAGAGGIKFFDNSVQTTAKRLVWDYTVTGSPVSAVTTTIPLNGIADGGYEFEFVIVNGYQGQNFYKLYYNNDQIDSHYTFDYIYNWIGSTVVYNTGDYTATIADLASGDYAVIHGNITITPDGHVGAVTNWRRTMGPVNRYRASGTHDKNAAVSNLTRLDIVSTVANGIGVNSRFRLWKRIP